MTGHVSMRGSDADIRNVVRKCDTLLDLCVASLRRGHANLLCVVPILTDDPRRESNRVYFGAHPAICLWRRGGALVNQPLVAAAASDIERTPHSTPLHGCLENLGFRDACRDSDNAGFITYTKNYDINISFEYRDLSIHNDVW